MPYSTNGWDRSSSSILPDWLNPDNNTSSIAPVAQAAAAMPNMGDINLAAVNGAPGAGGSWSSDFWGSLLGKTNADGSKVASAGSLGLGAAQGLMNGWMGMQQLKLGKESLAASKDQFAKNFAAQQKTTNAQLADRQAARVAANPTAYQSVGDYMKQNGI